MGSVYIQRPNDSNRSGQQQHSTSSNNSSGGNALGGLFVCFVLFKAAALLVTYIADTVGTILFAAASTEATIIGIIGLGTLLGGAVLLVKAGKVIALGTITAVFVAAFFLPGALIMLVCISASGLVVIYTISMQIAGSRRFALCIAALPIIGMLFYVPPAIATRDLTVHIGGRTGPPEQRAASLAQIRRGLATIESGRTAVLTYQVRDNKLYADIARGTDIQSMELDSSALTKTRFPWLQHDLTKRLAKEVATGEKNTSLDKILSPVTSTFFGFETVILADGALLNYAHAGAFYATTVFRSVTIAPEQIVQRVKEWHAPHYLDPKQTQIINAVPTSSDELRSIGLPTDAAHEWRQFSHRFTNAVPRRLAPTVSAGVHATKDRILSSFAQKRDVLVIVAHSDGYAIRLPNGESITATDIRGIADHIRANRPRIFLFSCDTARTNNGESFAKTLLDAGAEAVIAPVGKILVEDALKIFSKFVQRAGGAHALPIADAFAQALGDSGPQNLEIWVAQAARTANESDA